MSTITAATMMSAQPVAIGGIEYDVAIEYVAPVQLTPDAEALLQERIERAREAAQRVLQSGSVPLPADIETAIAEVLEARRRIAALQPRGTTMQALMLRRELFDAVDALGTLFDEETSHV